MNFKCILCCSMLYWCFLTCIGLCNATKVCSGTGTRCHLQKSITEPLWRNTTKVGNTFSTASPVPGTGIPVFGTAVTTTSTSGGVAVIETTTVVPKPMGSSHVFFTMTTPAPVVTTIASVADGTTSSYVALIGGSSSSTFVLCEHISCFPTTIDSMLASSSASSLSVLIMGIFPRIKPYRTPVPHIPKPTAVFPPIKDFIQGAENFAEGFLKIIPEPHGGDHRVCSSGLFSLVSCAIRGLSDLTGTIEHIHDAIDDTLADEISDALDDLEHLATDLSNDKKPDDELCTTSRTVYDLFSKCYPTTVVYDSATSTSTTCDTTTSTRTGCYIQGRTSGTSVTAPCTSTTAYDLFSKCFPKTTMVGSSVSRTTSCETTTYTRSGCFALGQTTGTTLTTSSCNPTTVSSCICTAYGGTTTQCPSQCSTVTGCEVTGTTTTTTVSGQPTDNIIIDHIYTEDPEDERYAAQDIWSMLSDNDLLFVPTYPTTGTGFLSASSVSITALPSIASTDCTLASLTATLQINNVNTTTAMTYCNCGTDRIDPGSSTGTDGSITSFCTGQTAGPITTSSSASTTTLPSPSTSTTGINLPPLAAATASPTATLSIMMYYNSGTVGVTPPEVPQWQWRIFDPQGQDVQVCNNSDWTAPNMTAAVIGWDDHRLSGTLDDLVPHNSNVWPNVNITFGGPNGNDTHGHGQRFPPGECGYFAKDIVAQYSPVGFFGCAHGDGHGVYGACREAPYQAQIECVGSSGVLSPMVTLEGYVPRIECPIYSNTIPE